MNFIFLLALTVFIEKSCSQTLSKDLNCFENGDTLMLNCITTDLTQGINFYKDSVDQGGCVPLVGCASGITQSGVTTSLEISSFSDSTNSGSWTCTYGGSTSTAVAIAANPCVETTEGPTEGLETSTTFEYSSIIESTSIVIESNAGISPTDVSQLNTFNTFPFPSDAENFSSSIFISDRKYTSASFETEHFETIDTSNASFFMHTTSSVPDSLLSSMSLIQNLDSYKTETISPLTVTIESGYQSVSDSILTELTIVWLTTGLYITTSKISSALNSSFSVTPVVYPTSTYTETVSKGMTISDIMFDIITEGNETTSITPITAANVFTHDSLADNIPVLQTTFDSIKTSGSPIHQPMETHITSTAMSHFFTSISEEYGFSSSFTLETPQSTNTVLTSDEHESMMTSKLVYQNTLEFELASGIIQTNSQSSSEISLDSYYSVSTLTSFLTTHEGRLINTNDPSFLKTESDMGLFSSSLVNQNLLSLHATTNYIKYASDSPFNVSNPESSVTSSTIILDFSTTSFSYSSVIDKVKHTSDFVMSSSFNEQSVSVTQNSFLSSLTIKTLIQTSSGPKNEAGSAYTEMHSSLPTKLFSSMPDKIIETGYSTYDDKSILLTSTEHILLVESSLNTRGSFARGIGDSVLITESFVKMISRSSNEMATSLSSLETFSMDVKTTTTVQHGISESSKDAIFISTVSGTIGAIILVVLIAMAVSGYILKRNKFKDKENEGQISNQLDWSNIGGMNSYSKNFTSRDYPFSGSIHLPLHSQESSFFTYADNYKKNWYDYT